MLKAVRSCKKLQVNEIYMVHGSSLCGTEGHMVRTKPRLYEYQERMCKLGRPTGAVNRGPGHEIDTRYKGEDKLCVTCGSTRVP